MVRYQTHGETIMRQAFRTRRCGPEVSPAHYGGPVAPGDTATVVTPYAVMTRPPRRDTPLHVVVVSLAASRHTHDHHMDGPHPPDTTSADLRVLPAQRRRRNGHADHPECHGRFDLGSPATTRS